MTKKYLLVQGQSREKLPPVSGQIADFDLKYCIMKGNTKNKTQEEVTKKPHSSIHKKWGFKNSKP